MYPECLLRTLNQYTLSSYGYNILKRACAQSVAPDTFFSARWGRAFRPIPTKTRIQQRHWGKGLPRRTPPPIRTDGRTDNQKIWGLSIIGPMATARSSCWSLTVNNPTPEDRSPILPPGWTVQGQEEVGKEGTPHLQLMLKCSRTERFSAVKKVFPRAHIEVARNPAALSAYVHKEETRVDEFRTTGIPSIFEYQKTIAKQWNDLVFKALRQSSDQTIEETVTEYVSYLVTREIAKGQEGAEWIDINPMWICSWKKHWRSILKRERMKALEPKQPMEAVLTDNKCAQSDSAHT